MHSSFVKRSRGGREPGHRCPRTRRAWGSDEVAVALLLAFVTLAPSAVRAPAARAESLVRAARGQIGRTTRYDSGYRALAYPGGDPPIEAGVCTDVVVRALRESLGVDLQVLVHEDMERNFSEYPRDWGLDGPDPNIDHRRVPNLMTWLRRKGYEIPASTESAAYKPGDLVTCTVPPSLPHIMIVSDRTNGDGRPLVIHNIGRGTREEDRLFEFPHTGHFRLPPAR